MVTNTDQYFCDRTNLRKLLRTQPNWINSQFAQALNRSLGWVKKWKARFRRADPVDQAVLKGQPQIRHTPYPKYDQSVLDRIEAIRREPPENLARVPGPKAIAYYLPRDPQIKAAQLKLPRSTATIHRILDKLGLIYHRKPRKIKHLPLVTPLQHLQLDFKDSVSVIVDEEGPHYHAVETLNVIDCGTDILRHFEVRGDFNAETSLRSVVVHLQQYGCPKTMTFDRDPRWVGGAQSRDFPSAFVRMLHCFGIEPCINPPHRPDMNCYVERYNKSYGRECLKVKRPTNLAETQAATTEWVKHYNEERPNQARSCGNQPPCVAHPPESLPALPPLPTLIDPDRWLYALDGSCFTRKVQSNGSVDVDKTNYYVKNELAGSYVGLRVVAVTGEFEIMQEQEIIGRIKIKGLHNHQEMLLDEYIELISQEARSLERRRQLK